MVERFSGPLRVGPRSNASGHLRSLVLGLNLRVRRRGSFLKRPKERKFPKRLKFRNGFPLYLIAKAARGRGGAWTCGVSAVNRHAKCGRAVVLCCFQKKGRGELTTPPDEDGVKGLPMRHTAAGGCKGSIIMATKMIGVPVFPFTKGSERVESRQALTTPGQRARRFRRCRKDKRETSAAKDAAVWVLVVLVAEGAPSFYKRGRRQRTKVGPLDRSPICQKSHREHYCGVRRGTDGWEPYTIGVSWLRGNHSVYLTCARVLRTLRRRVWEWWGVRA